MTRNSSSLIDIENYQQLQNKNSKKIESFQKLIDEIESIDDKKKGLWKEIYENAIEDRLNAYMMFTKLVNIAENNSSEHAIHGRTICSFIERMNKANDQLLKLVDLISKSEEQNDIIDADEIFDKIGNANKLTKHK